MAEETKMCPFCGEEILAVAKKCKHCGEFLDERKINKDNCGDLISNADVNDKWKQRFRAVDFFVLDGRWWKYRPGFWKTSIGERFQYSCILYLADFLSVVAATLFGPIYYICKGMWLKAIVYSVLSIITGGLFWIAFPCLASYDYYRYKLLGKQW